MSVEQKTMVLGIKNQYPAQDTTTALAAVIQAEAEALFNLSKELPPQANHLVTMILATKGKLVLSGIGKSGLVAKKMVATFSSLGIAAFFLHPDRKSVV